MRPFFYFPLALGITLASCNRDEVIPAGGSDVPEENPTPSDEQKLWIMPLAGTGGEVDRYTFSGRKVCIVAMAPGYTGYFTWMVNGVENSSKDNVLDFIPDFPGKYSVRVEINTNGILYASECDIVAVDATEKERLRLASPESSSFSTEVFEYLPAPGQFVAEAKDVTTPEEASRWAKERLVDGKMVSLGAFGGSLVVGFDHSILASGNDFDFSVRGNAFISENGASNEPGIVWVMQDVNGNGLPDDEWYELRGSEYYEESTLHNTYVTYYRPESTGMDVMWTDAKGMEGSIKYLFALKPTGRSYYPAWIEADSYTLYGSRISSRNVLNSSGSLWSNNPYPWGYADNIGTDNLNDPSLGPGSHCGFRIANAVNADGTPVHLTYIDFVRIQCATQAQSGPLGEISTEIYSIRDLNTYK